MKQEVVDKAVEFIQGVSRESRVYIGTDSKRRLVMKGVHNVIFTTVIVCHLDGNKGCKIFADVEVVTRYKGDIQVRLLEEVSRAIDCHQLIKDRIDDREIEIHLDLNAKKEHKSNSVAKAAIGWVKGVCGCEVRIKPDSFAASYAADMWHQKYM